MNNDVHGGSGQSAFGSLTNGFRRYPVHRKGPAVSMKVSRRRNGETLSLKKALPNDPPMPIDPIALPPWIESNAVAQHIRLMIGSLNPLANVRVAFKRPTV